MTTDPFTEVLKAFWDMLESRPEFTSLVTIKNRIKLWEGSAKPEKTKISVADLPEVAIIPIGGEYNPTASSSSVSITQVYRIVMVDGDLRLHKTFFPLKWAVLKAMSNLDKYLNLPYVRQVVVSEHIDDRNDEGHPGWNSGIDIQVGMWFDRTIMKGTA